MSDWRGDEEEARRHLLPELGGEPLDEEPALFCDVLDLIRRARAAERERCVRVLDSEGVRYGTAAEGKEEPEFSRWITAEYTCHSVASKLRALTDEDADE